jgi:hypothetical protein
MKKNCDADIGHDMWGRTICLHVTINIRIYHVQAHEEEDTPSEMFREYNNNCVLK